MTTDPALHDALAAALRSRLDELDLDWRDAARVSGMSRRKTRSILMGETSASLHELQCLAVFMESDVDSLLLAAQQIHARHPRGAF